jgi:hypothetical protein
MNSIESLVEHLSTSENKQRLVSFFGIINDIVKKPQQVNIEENDDSSLVVFQKNGALYFNVTSGFIKALGKNTLSVYGEINGNVVYQPKVPEIFNPTQSDYDRLQKTFILFKRHDEGWHATFNDEIIAQIQDINTVNMIKRNNMSDDTFQMVQNKLCEFQVNYHIIDVNPWPETETIVDNVKTVYIDRPVITEKIVEVQKVVIKEVPIYVDKVAIKEVPVYVDKVPAAVQLPMSEVLDVESDKEEESQESSPSETSESSEETSESSEESSESKEPQSKADDASESQPIKIKGIFLNTAHTIIKSGEYVYRIIKKVNGPTKLEAIGRWDVKQKAKVGATWLKLLPSDTKKITSLGHTVAKKPE